MLLITELKYQFNTLNLRYLLNQREQKSNSKNMKPELENIELVKNDAEKQFEMTVDGYKSFIQFNELSDRIALVHTEVPEELGGKGVGTALVEKTLNFIEKSGKKLMPYCPFVFAYIKRHPEWKRIVSEKFPYYEQLG